MSKRKERAGKIALKLAANRVILAAFRETGQKIKSGLKIHQAALFVAKHHGMAIGDPFNKVEFATAIRERFPNLKIRLRRMQRPPEKPVPTGRQFGRPDILGFYDSWEWKRLHYAFLKGRDRRCMCCNASAADGVKIVVDHIKPIRHHWHLRLDPENLQILCDDCNMGKGSIDETDWRYSPTPSLPSRA